ncbi:MAG: helix-turn-helix domain-containing protein [Ruminiclostridium sp.]|nr:helix-turn-helix domain-containing protein [Ruminiclostridium sp.]
MYYVDYKKLGERIAARRRELGLKQWQVNDMAGLSDKYLSNIERASSVPSVDVLMRLCSALDTTPDALLLGASSAENEGDCVKSAVSKISKMNDRQIKLAESLLDWILMQDI